jgi:hypothetical protein
MTTTEILTRCGRLKVKLRRMGNELEIDAPRGAVDADLRADLIAHREEILAALAPPDPLADPIFEKMTQWLYEVIRTSNGEWFTDEHGRQWNTLETAGRLVLDPWSMEWLANVEQFSKAVGKRYPFRDRGQNL